MTWTKPCLVEFDAHTITAVDVCIDDLKESAEYLEWVRKSKKRWQESFATHAMFFDALIDELNYAVSVLECIRPPTEKYSTRPLKNRRTPMV